MDRETRGLNHTRPVWVISRITRLPYSHAIYLPIYLSIYLAISQAASDRLVREALLSGRCSDNVSVVLALLGGAGEP